MEILGDLKLHGKNLNNRAFEIANKNPIVVNSRYHYQKSNR